jgi:GAF domain-containing protein
MSIEDPTIFASLADSLADIEGVPETIDQIVGFAVETIGTNFGGITLLNSRGRAFKTVGATHESVHTADALQYDLREGPCVDAAVADALVISAYLATDERWPTWGPRASLLGFNSILSAEMHARGRRIGALNLYGAEEATFTREDMVLAALFARQGALALGYARSEEGLRQALETRTVIGQAQGLLMERLEIDADRAFSTLKRYSQQHNIKLKVLCRQLVETRALPTHVVDGQEAAELMAESAASLPEPA